jgi:hypothetical protein
MRKLIPFFLGLCGFLLTGALPLTLLVYIASACGPSPSGTAASPVVSTSAVSYSSNLADTMTTRR